MPVMRAGKPEHRRASHSLPLVSLRRKTFESASPDTGKAWSRDKPEDLPLPFKEHPPAGLRDGVTAAHVRYRYGTGRCRQSGINAVMFVLALMLLMTPQAQDTLSASQVSSDRYDSPAVRTVTSGQIASMPDATVPELLRHTAGVQIRDYGGLGGLKTVNVRSLGSQHTGVFVDGVKVNNVQNGQVDLGRYCSEDLESVSVSSGGPSSLLQSASELASSATVSLRTAFPDFSRPWSLAARAEYGSFTTGSAYLSAMKRLSRRSCLKVTGDCRHTAGDYPFTYTNRYGADTTARRQNSDLTSFQIGPSFLMRSEKSLLHLKANWYHSDRGLPGPVIRQAGPSLCGDRQRDDDVFIQGNYRYSLRKFSMKLAGKYAYSCCNYLQDTVGNSSSRRLDLHYRQQEACFSTAAAYRHGNFGFSLAWDNTVSCLDSDVSGLSGKRRWSSMLAAQAEYCYKDLSVNASAVYHHALDFSSRASGTSQVLRPYKPVSVHQIFSGKFPFSGLLEKFVQASDFQRAILCGRSVGQCGTRPPARDRGPVRLHRFIFGLCRAVVMRMPGRSVLQYHRRQDSLASGSEPVRVVGLQLRSCTRVWLHPVHESQLRVP